jgi:hypothetical protein
LRVEDVVREVKEVREVNVVKKDETGNGIRFP